ncbi:MAG: glycosyltransferase family 4 protein [Petrotogales bacterium]
MKILLVVAYFIPEIGSAAHVYYDLAKAFIKRGHEVHVLTSYPREFNLYDEDRGKTFPLDENIDGISVHRCKHPAQRDNVVLRGFEHFLLPRYYFKTYKRLNQDFDVILMYIPPLPLYNLARKIKKYDETPSVLNFQDFHPQELVDVGVMKNPFWIKIMEHIEKKAYKNADFITVLSKKGIDYIVERGGDSDKIRHIYNGVLLETFDKQNLKKDFKEKQGIQNKTLVTYAGILSPYQGVDVFLDAAKQLQNDDSLVFYIVGEGSEKTHLERRIKDENISNVKLLPFQTRDEYFNIINSSDISVVSLDKRMKAPCLPGKIKDSFGVSRPIVACVPKDSETADVIRESQSGFVVEPGNVKKLSEIVMRLKEDSDKRGEKGNNGRHFLEKNMNLEKNVVEYERIFPSLSN